MPTTITHNRNDYQDQLVIEVDLGSKAIAAIKEANASGDRKSSHTIATASLEKTKGKETPKQEQLSTRDEFLRKFYASKDDSQKVAQLLREIKDECNPVVRLYREKGITELELEDYGKRQSPRDYNLALLEK